MKGVIKSLLIILVLTFLFDHCKNEPFEYDGPVITLPIDTTGNDTIIIPPIPTDTCDSNVVYFQ